MRKHCAAPKGGLWRYPVVLAAGWVLGLLLLWLVFLIPGDGMMENARRSVATLEGEGLYPRLEPSVTITQMDNYTEAWAINLAVNTAGDGQYTAWQRACNPYFPVMQLPEGVEANPLTNLSAYLQNPSEAATLDNYGIYWCGALIPVRLTLLFTDYQGLRIINLVLQALLVLATVFAVWKAAGPQYLIPLAIFLAAMYLPTMWRSIQFSTCYYLALGGALFVALRSLRGRRRAMPAMTFMVLGMLTAYFPFLTFPVIVLGLPLLVDGACDKESAVRERLWRILCLSVMWGIGFAVMWGGKWAICYLSGNGAGTLTAFDKIGMYQSSQQDSRLGIVLRNLMVYPKKWIVLMLLPSAALLAWGAVQNRRRLGGYLLAMLPGLLTALIPIVWMLLTTTHAAMHYWFTARNFGVVFAALCCMALAAPAPWENKSGSVVQSHA